MTQFPHDQFAKELLKELLSPLGQVETGFDVVSERREFDVWFVPTQENVQHSQRLGWLASLVAIPVASSLVVPTAFEAFRNPIDDGEVYSCIGKLHNTYTRLERQVKREGRTLAPQEMPQLWMLTPTASAPLLSEFGFRQVSKKMRGVYRMPKRNRTGVVVIHQLLEVEETLWLRILGRGRTQEKAIAQLAALPSGDLLRTNGLELVYSLQEQLKARLEREQVPLDREDKKLIMVVSTLFQERLEAARLEGRLEGVEEGIERGRTEGIERGIEQGIEQGIERGIEQGIEQGLEQGLHRGQRLILENLLRVRFGELDPIMPVLIEGIAALSPEQFALFLLQFSQVGNDEAGRQVLPRLFVEELLKFRWGEAEEGEDRESSIQAMLALSVEALTEILVLVKSGSKDEVLLAIADD
jgi:hypothetical protein